MKTYIIYTLDWVKKEADMIANYWNGKDKTYVDGNGEERKAEDADIAKELLVKLAEVDKFIDYLGI